MADRLDVTRQRPARKLCREVQMTTRARLVALVLACVSLAGCGFYSADPITASVVDADTGAPLADVNVVATWELKGGLEGGNLEGYANVVEAVTDEHGTFHLPGWGPRPNLSFGRIRNIDAPAIMLFKGGYRYRAVENEGSSMVAAPSQMKSTWNGKVILLTRFKGSPAEYKKSFLQLATDVDGIENKGFLSSVPKFVCALNFQDEALAAQGVPNALYSSERLRARGLSCKR